MDHSGSTPQEESAALSPSMLAAIQAAVTSAIKPLAQDLENKLNKGCEEASWEEEEGCDDPESGGATISEDIQNLINQQQPAGAQEEDPLRVYKGWVKEPEDGPPLSDEIAVIVDKLIVKGLEDQEIKARMATYSKPGNSKNLTKMKVNPEIWSGLSTGARSRDVGLQALQSDLSAGMTAVARLADSLKGQKEELATAMDAMAILSHVHRGLSLKRREFLKPEASEQGRQAFALSHPSDGLLFGENLGQRMKDIAEGNAVTRRFRAGGGLAPRFRPRGVARGRPPYPQRGAPSGRGSFLGGRSRPPRRGRGARGFQKSHQWQM